MAPYCRDPSKRDVLGSLFAELERSTPAAADGAGSGGSGSSEAGGATPPQQEGQPPAGEGGAQQQQAQHAQHARGHGHGSHREDVLLWVRLYQAQHHDLLGNTQEALRLIDQCIEVRRPQPAPRVLPTYPQGLSQWEGRDMS